MGFRPLLALMLFLPAANVLAAEDPSCKLDQLTNDCKMFSPDGPQLIPVGDGTYLPNFSAMEQEAKKRSESQDLQESLKAFDSVRYKLLDVRTKIAQALDEVGDQELPVRTKLYLLTGMDLTALFPKDPEQVPTQMRTLWPFGDPRATLQTVRTVEAQAAIRALVGPKVSSELAAAMKELPNLRDLLPKSDAIKALNTVTPERRKAVDALVARTRELLIDQIKAGRAEGQLAPSELEAIKKIRNIKTTPPDQLQSNPVCLAPVPNAFYDPINHSINICTNFYNLPDSTIVSVVGHELGHSIDACDSQFGTFTIDTANLDRLRKPNGDPINEVADDDDRFELFYLLDALSRTPGEKALPLELASDPAAIRYFTEKGIVKPSVKGVPFSLYAFKDAYTCLRDQEGFRGISSAEIQKLAGEVTRSRASRRGRTYNRVKDEANIVKAFNAYPECTSVEKASQMGEVMADYFGSKTLAAYLKDAPAPKTPEQRVAPISFFASISCVERFEDTGKKEKESIGATIMAALADFSRLFDPHPASTDRLEKIFLGDASVRAKLCPKADPMKASTCAHDPRSVSREPIAQSAASKSAKEAK